MDTARSLLAWGKALGWLRCRVDFRRAQIHFNFLNLSEPAESTAERMAGMHNHAWQMAVAVEIAGWVRVIQGKAQIYGFVYYYYLSTQIYGCVYYYSDGMVTDRSCMHRAVTRLDAKTDSDIVPDSQ